MDPALVKQINQRVQDELLKKEIEVIQYGLNELEGILKKRHQDMAGLQSDIHALVGKFQNRLKILKTSRIS